MSSVEAATIPSAPIPQVEAVPVTAEYQPDVAVQAAPDKATHVLLAARDIAARAKGAVRNDGLDRAAQQEAANPMHVLVGTAGIGVVLAGNVVGSVGAMLSVGERWRLYALARIKAKPIMVGQGYGLQCIRVSNESRTAPDGKVAVAVHPRQYNGETEHADLARARLADALEAVEVARSLPKSPITHVVVPASAARNAGLPLEGRTSYKVALTDIAAQTPRVPYEQDGAVIVPADKLAELVELLRGGEDYVLSQVLRALAASNGSKAADLTARNPRLVQVLHGVLERKVTDEMSTRIKEKGMRDVMVVKVVDGELQKRVARVPDGSLRTITEDVTTLLDKSDRYNPGLVQIGGKRGIYLGNQDLRSATGGEDTMDGILRKLNEGGYDDKQLVRIALELLERKSADPNSAGTAPQVDLSSLPKGEAPKVIEAARSPKNRNSLRSRFVGRVAIATAVTVAAMSLLSQGAGALKGLGSHSQQPSSGSADANAMKRADAQSSLAAPKGAIRIDDHGLTQQSRYWHRYVEYHYGGKYRWTSNGSETYKDIALQSGPLPEQTPHMTLTFFSRQTNEWLPIEDGTAVARLRVFDDTGKPLHPTLSRAEDGSVRVDLGLGNALPAYDKIYQYQYDLVADTTGEWAVHANQPMVVSNGSYIQHPESYPGAAQSPEAMADYTRNNFTYDASSAYGMGLSQATHNEPEAYTAAVYRNRRGDCSEINSAIGMVSAQVRPLDNLGLVLGYSHKDDPNYGHSYLMGKQAHGWLNDGNTVDGTPPAGDLLQNDPVIQGSLDDTWKNAVGTLTADWNQGDLQSNQKHNQHLPLDSLALLGVAGLAALEMRKRYIYRGATAALRADRAFTAHMDLDIRDAVQMLLWRAHSGADSPHPMPSNGANYRGENPDNIPLNVLRVAARKDSVQPGLNKRQQRGLRNVARALLHERGRHT